MVVVERVYVLISGDVMDESVVLMVFVNVNVVAQKQVYIDSSTVVAPAEKECP